jgi:hypothetical protein
VAVDYVPNRAWSAPVRCAPGEYRFHGGAHTDYPGNDVDKVVLDLAAKTVTVTQMRRPRVPVATDPMYGAGGGNPIPLSDGTFEPTTIHGWGRQSYIPGVGYIFVNNNMVGGVSKYVMNRYDEATGTFVVLEGAAVSTGHSVGDQLLEWDQEAGVLPILHGNGHPICEVHEYKPGVGLRWVRTIAQDLVGHGAQGGGVSRVYLGAHKHLIYRPYSWYAGQFGRLFTYDHASGAVADVPVPDYVKVAGGGDLSLAVDRAAGMVYAGFKATDRPQGIAASLGIMRAPISTLIWERWEIAGAPTWGALVGNDSNTDGALQRQPLWVEAGHLVLIDFISKEWVNDYWMRTRVLAVPLTGPLGG